jgi:hypothetical protein
MAISQAAGTNDDVEGCMNFCCCRDERGRRRREEGFLSLGRLWSQPSQVSMTYSLLAHGA